VVTVDALPGRTFTGRVEKIAPLPDAQMIWMNPDLKVYDTEVYLDGGGDYLRTGMSCKAEIIIEEYKDVVQIPVQAVLRIGGEPTVYVLSGKGFEPRRVKVGLDNNRMIRIIEGLQPGEVVLLTPPLAAATVEQQGAVGAVGEEQKPEAERNEQERPKIEGGPSPEQMKKMREKFEKMTPEEREAEMQKMREKFESMSDEEKEKMRKQWEGRRQQQAGEGK
jgi:hypothetical protein